jgi:hypothetical protein
VPTRRDHRTRLRSVYCGRRQRLGPSFVAWVMNRRRRAPRLRGCCARRWFLPSGVARRGSRVHDATPWWQARLLSSGFSMGRFTSNRSAGATSGWRKRVRGSQQTDADDGAGVDTTLAAAAAVAANDQPYHDPLPARASSIPSAAEDGWSMTHATGDQLRPFPELTPFCGTQHERKNP